jgi:hypothetical protein
MRYVIGLLCQIIPAEVVHLAEEILSYPVEDITHEIKLAPGYNAFIYSIKNINLVLVKPSLKLG